MRMYPKPKSAPPRMKSKFMANKSNAMKEMEAWVKKDADPLGTNIEASRMSGQLVDNVTEERMLKSKLWELSKERYKFLSQTAYEKKVFMDRMHRKSSAISRIVSQSDMFANRRPSFENSVSSVSSYQTGKSLNARQAFLERMDPKKGRDRPREIRCLEEGSKDKKVSFPPQNLVTEAMSGSKAFTNSYRRSYDKSPVQALGGKDTTSSKLPHVVSTTTAVSAASSTMLGALGRQRSDGVKTWAQKGPLRRYGTSLQSLTSDPRYSHLEHALTPVKDYQTPSDLKHLVNNMDCLHLPPKLPKETKKPRIGLKAVDFMKERGFVF